MDIICRRCGEPWDMDSLHEETQARLHGAYDPDGRSGVTGESPVYRDRYATVSEEFRRIGCDAFRTAFGSHCTDHDDLPPEGAELATMAGTIYDLLGEDMDGAAAMLEDLGL